MRSLPYLKDAEILQVSKNTLTCRLERKRAVKIRFFGGLRLGTVEARRQAPGAGVWVASLLDIAGTEAKVLPERAEEKDYRDIAALLEHEMGLAEMLASANAIYGPSFNPMLSLKALTYFSDVPGLPVAMQSGLSAAALGFDFGTLPVYQALPPASGREAL